MPTERRSAAPRKVAARSVRRRAAEDGAADEPSTRRPAARGSAAGREPAEPVERKKVRRRARRWLPREMDPVREAGALALIGAGAAVSVPPVVSTFAPVIASVFGADGSIDPSALEGSAIWASASYGAGGILAAMRLGWIPFLGVAVANVVSGAMASSATGEAWPVVAAALGSGLATLTFNGVHRPARAKRKPARRATSKRR